MRSQAHYNDPLIPCPLLPEYGAKGSIRSFRVMVFVFADALLLPRQSTTHPANICNPRIFCRDPMRTSKIFCLAATSLSRSLPPLLLSTLWRRGRGMRSQAHYTDSLIPAPFSPSTGRRGVAGVLGLWFFIFADAPLPPRQSTTNSANICTPRIFCRDPMRTSKTFCLVATGLSRLLPPEEAPDMESDG